MTNEQKVEIYRMRLEGASLQECADRFGVTKQYISQIGVVRGRASFGVTCLYPGLKRWMAEHECSNKEFADRCGVSVGCLTGVITKRHAPSKPVIDRILDVTGLTYEEAFK